MIRSIEKREPDRQDFEDALRELVYAATKEGYPEIARNAEAVIRDFVEVVRKNGSKTNV
jgi:hypothetical protein